MGGQETRTVTPRGTELHAALGREKGGRGDKERRRRERGEKDVATRPGLDGRVGFRRTKRTRQGAAWRGAWRNLLEPPFAATGATFSAIQPHAMLVECVE
jgi:hypothetical protein